MPKNSFLTPWAIKRPTSHLAGSKTTILQVSIRHVVILKASPVSTNIWCFKCRHIMLVSKYNKNKCILNSLTADISLHRSIDITIYWVIHIITLLPEMTMPSQSEMNESRSNWIYTWSGVYIYCSISSAKLYSTNSTKSVS